MVGFVPLIQRLLATACLTTACLAIAVFCFACSGEEDASGEQTQKHPSPSSICDGSQTIRFAASVNPHGPQVWGTDLIFEHGYEYIYVDGKCNFAVWSASPDNSESSPWGIWSPARLGKLSDQLAEELAQDWNYEKWSEIETEQICQSQVLGADTLSLSNGKDQLRLYGGCVSTHSAFSGAFDAMDEWLKRLYPLGTDASGDVLLRVFETENFLGEELSPWPLSEPAGKFVHPQDSLSQSKGPKTLLTGADANSFRDLRESLAQRFQRSSPAGAPHEESMKMYLFVFRDVLPFEQVGGNVLRKRD